MTYVLTVSCYVSMLQRALLGQEATEQPRHWIQRNQACYDEQSFDVSAI
jgi:hypothetical protein